MKVFRILIGLGLFTATAQTPAGFQSAQPAGGTATVLTAHFPGRSGRAAMKMAFDNLRGYFDQRPRTVRALESNDGAELQVLFNAARRGQAVHGFAHAASGRVKVVFDTADRFAQSMTAGGGGSVPMRRVAFPDGTGWLSMPDGWRLVSTRNNVVMAEGPHGAIDFGLAMQVYTRDFAARSPFPPPAVSDYGNPVQSLTDLFGAKGLMRSVRLIERAPSPGWEGVAEYLHFTADYQGVPSEMLALVLERPMGPGSWFLYYSQVRTPAGQFAKNLPVLLEIWKSWKTDDRVFQQRLNQAVESMQACGRIIREVNTNRQQAMDRSTAAWSHVIRGTWPVEDTQTGTRRAGAGDVAQTVRDLNTAAGYERWRVIPYQELNQ